MNLTRSKIPEDTFLHDVAHMEIVHGPDNMQPGGLMHNGTSPAIHEMQIVSGHFVLPSG